MNNPEILLVKIWNPLASDLTSSLEAIKEKKAKNTFY